MRIFGDWGDREGTAVPTPIGQACRLCDEDVQEGDAGEMMARGPIHRECIALVRDGHRFGICVCNDFAGMATVRDAALELARRMKAARN